MIKRFASDEGLLKTLDVVTIRVQGKGRDLSIYVEALCVPYILQEF